MKVLLIVALVLLLLLLLPFGAAVRYDEGGLQAWARVWCFSFQVYPRVKKEKKKREKMPKKPKREQPPPKKEPEKEKKGGSLDLVRAVLPLVKPALAGVKKRLTIDDLQLHVTWAAADPADAAIGYGCANAALGALWAVIDENFKVKKSRLGCGVDFDSAQSAVTCKAAFSINLWKTLTLALPLLVRFYRAYTRQKERRDEKTRKEA